jgi:adenosylmethionine-8-amino-7-oxononanoate aminotransferase
MYGDASLQRTALDHLWLHFTRKGDYADPEELQVMVRGAGCYLEDSRGRRYLDALAGLFCVNIGYALELVRDKDTRTTFSPEECDRLLRGFLSRQLFERGLLCRADDRGDPVVQISPPLVARQEQFDEIAEILGGVLDEASDRMAVAT